VRVAGNRFYRDGAPWVAEGVVLVGLASPEGVGDPRAAYAAARSRLGPGTFGEILDYGADTVRYQVSQAGLDLEAAAHDPGYRDTVLAAVAAARKAGLTVIVSMRKQARDPDGMPNDSTRRARRAIASDLGNDRGILLKLYNEPALRERPAANWAVWQADMQGLIDLVRAEGATNVLLVDGLRFAHYLGGAPALSDPEGQLGYAVHPYLTTINRTPRQWDENFGDFDRHRVQRPLGQRLLPRELPRGGRPAAALPAQARYRPRRLGLRPARGPAEQRPAHHLPRLPLRPQGQRRRRAGGAQVFPRALR
jgi:hypothetical protein